MKTFLASIVLVTFSLVTNVQANNIYQEGTLGNSMYKQVEAVLPKGVTPVFILASDKMFFMNQIDSTKMSKSPVTLDSLAYALNNIKPSVVKVSRAFVMNSNKIPGNEKASFICPMIFSDIKYATNSRTLFHESLHCKTNLDSHSLAYRKAITPAFNSVSGVSAPQFAGIFAEALAAALQVAYAANDGLTEGLDMVKEAASMNAPGHHSFGPKFARHFLKLCGKKGSCPTDTMEMVNKLTGDQDTMSIIVEDIVAMDKFKKSKGIFIADAK